MSAARRPAVARFAVLALAVLCLSAGWLLGRLSSSASPRATSYLQQVTEALDLRPDQVAALEVVLSEEDRELNELLSRDLSGLRAEVDARRARTEQELLALLDDAQRRRYDELVAIGTGR